MVTIQPHPAARAFGTFMPLSLLAGLATVGLLGLGGVDLDDWWPLVAGGLSVALFLVASLAVAVAHPEVATDRENRVLKVGSRRVPWGSISQVERRDKGRRSSLVVHLSEGRPVRLVLTGAPYAPLTGPQRAALVETLDAAGFAEVAATLSEVAR